MAKAIFFDLGSTLWDDYPLLLHQWGLLSGLLAKRGITASREEIITKAHEVIGTYSPSLTRSIAWQYLEGDREEYQKLIQELVGLTTTELDTREGFIRLNPLFPGVNSLLEELRGKYILAVVSQHFTRVKTWMGHYGLDQYFAHVSVSEEQSLFKPDPRLFEFTCRAVDVNPRDVIMVGDRLDNDIWPANRLRMTTVRVLAEPYRIQRPRYHSDMPDYTIGKVTDLPALPCIKCDRDG